LTPRDFRKKAEAKINQRQQEWEFQDMLNAVHCSLVANINRNTEKKPDPFTDKDFRVIRNDKEEIMSTAENIDRKLKMWSAMTGGKNAGR
jgi:hypothetical protein